MHFSYKISDTINAATDAIVAGSPKRASFAFIAVAVPPVLVVIVLRVLNLCVGGTLCTPCGVAPRVSVRLIGFRWIAVWSCLSALDGLSDAEIDQLTPLFRNHLPTIMAEMGFQRLHSNVPRQYIFAAIGSSLASKLVRPCVSRDRGTLRPRFDSDVTSAGL